jgi:hypothetical protein
MRLPRALPNQKIAKPARLLYFISIPELFLKHCCKNKNLSIFAMMLQK